MTAARPLPPPVTTPPEDFEREWHTFKPAALEGTGGDGPKPLYPVVTGEGCRLGGSIAKDSVYICGRDAVRIGPEGLIFDPFRSGGGMALEEEVPESVFERGDEVWVETKPRTQRWPGSDSKPWDYFFVYRGSVRRFHDGAWKRFPTLEHPEPYGSGSLVFDLPRFDKPVDRKAPGCEDFGCARVLPLFWSADANPVPDFKALDGKIAWIHPYENEWDWAYVVEPKGGVHVVMRALDLTTTPNRRVVGVLSWTEKDGARFEPISALTGDVHFTASVERPKSGGFHFLLTTWTPPKTPKDERPEIKYVVRRDGERKWSVTKQPPPKPVKRDPYEGYEVPSDGAEVDGYRVSRAGMLERKSGDGWSWIESSPGTPQISKGNHGDLQLHFHFYGLYRSIQPPELFVLTDYWGDLHPWPQEAKADCPHPFAVFDALDEETYNAILDEANKSGLAKVAPWGTLPAEWSHLGLVSFRLFKPTLIVIGASVPEHDFKELKAQMDAPGDRFGKRKLPRWSSVGLSGSREASGIYCARPINPTPFVPPR